MTRNKAGLSVRVACPFCSHMSQRIRTKKQEKRMMFRSCVHGLCRCPSSDNSTSFLRVLKFWGPLSYIKMQLWPKDCNTQNLTKDKSIESAWLGDFYSLATFILFLLWFLKPSENLDFLLKDNYMRTARKITQTHHKNLHYEHLCTPMSEDLVIFTFACFKTIKWTVHVYFFRSVSII